jgi:hypothetical protein
MLRVAGLSFKQGHAEKTDCHPKHFGYRQGFEFQRPQDENEDRTQRRDRHHDNNDRILRGSLTQDDGEAALVDNHVFEWLLAQPGQQLSDHMRSVDTSEMARTNCLGRCRVCTAVSGADRAGSRVQVLLEDFAAARERFDAVDAWRVADSRCGRNANRTRR